MKKLALLAAVLLFGAMSVDIASGHKVYPQQSMPMMDHGMMMGRGMMGYGMMRQSDMGCPMMMGFVEGASFYLSYSEELGLSDTQIRDLKSIRDSYKKDAVKMSADLDMLILEFRHVLDEENIDLSKAKKLNRQIESMQADMRLKNIEAFIKAKQVLNKEQFKVLRRLGMGFYEEERSRGMMRR